MIVGIIRILVVVVAVVLVDDHAFELARIFDETVLFVFGLLVEFLFHHEIRSSDVQHLLAEFLQPTSSLERVEVLADVLQNVVTVSQLVYVLLFPHDFFEFVQARRYVSTH